MVGRCRFMHGLNPGRVEAQGLFWKSPKSVKDRSSSVPLPRPTVLPQVWNGTDLAK